MLNLPKSLVLLILDGSRYTLAQANNVWSWQMVYVDGGNLSNLASTMPAASGIQKLLKYPVDYFSKLINL